MKQRQQGIIVLSESAIFHIGSLQVDKSSLRLFKVAIAGLHIIKYFSAIQRLHRFERLV